MDTMLRQAQQYVGTPYVPGVFDCADLAVKVQWELFQRLVPLQTERKRPRGVRGQARLITSLKDQVGDRIDGPDTGCVVLLTSPAGEGTRWHIGTVFVVGNAVWVLHNSALMGNAWLQRLPDLERMGARVEGFYAWRQA